MASAASRLKPPLKTDKRRNETLLGLREQVVTPGDGIAHRLLTFGQITGAAGQERQTAVEPGEQGRRTQDVDAGRGQLDCEREPIQVLANRRDIRRVLVTDSKSGRTAAAREAKSFPASDSVTSRLVTRDDLGIASGGTG